MNLKTVRSGLISLDSIIMWILLLQIIAFRWLNIHELINYLIIALILLRFVMSRKVSFMNRSAIAAFLLTVYSLINMIILGGDFYVFTANVYRVMKCLIIFAYIAFLLTKRIDFIVAFLLRKVKFLNAWFLIQIPVILMQLNGNYALVGLRNYSVESQMREDLISGLFGLYGTPHMALFTCLLLSINYLYYRYSGNNKKGILFLDFFYFVFMIWLSFQNDNKGFFVILVPYLLCLYWTDLEGKMKSRGKRARTTVFKMIPVLLAAIMLLYALYRIATPLREMIDYIIFTIQLGFTPGNVARGSFERFGMISYVLFDKDHVLLGYGLGNYASDNATNFGFDHFGQSNFGSYMCLGGIVFIVLLLLYVFRVFQSIFAKSSFSLIALVLFISLSIYTQLFSDAVLMICFMLFIAVCKIEMEPILKERPEHEI